MTHAANDGNQQKFPDPIPHTVDAIYRTYEVPQERRTYLGLSTLGNDCDRALWYAFRWAHPPEQFDGRMLRLFQTGHREESRMIDDLRNAGVDVQDRAEDGDQIGVTTCGGHVRGHLDGVAAGFPEAPAARHVCEFKTHNGKSFAALKKNGVRKSKQGHWRQMQGYMHLTGVDRAFYLAHCKDNDELYSERIEYDPVEAAQLMARCERIVTAATPPGRMSDDPDFYLCRWCAARSVCHEGQFAEINCRTCLHSTADTTNGGWHCGRHNEPIADDVIPDGCNWHLLIPDLVPGEQIDASEEHETVTYRMLDGSTWVDGGERGVR